MEYYCTVTASQTVITEDFLDAAGLCKVRAVKYPKGKPNTVKQHSSQGALASTMLLKNCLRKTDSVLSLPGSYLQQINLENKIWLYISLSLPFF